jgi:hypothetical protein
MRVLRASISSGFDSDTLTTWHFELPSDGCLLAMSRTMRSASCQTTNSFCGFAAHFASSCPVCCGPEESAHA